MCIRDRYKELRKEYEESPINRLRQEVNAKEMQLVEINRKVDRATRAKEQYKENYEKVKTELVRLRNTVEAEKEQSLEKQREEIGKLRLQLATQKFAEEEQKEMRLIKTQLEILQKEYTVQSPAKVDTAQAITLIVGSAKEMEASNFMEGNALERLIAERMELLASGLYNENDEVIRVLTEQIEQAQRMGY
eukprot:TRINITY_DN2079_c0_g3_i9.p1 TRINITY_DN2079_c0_g3~~TRINITY_DN2079_c0_g3_i9.p1  ORF type:complete len:191 (+),score=81.39 TRINITY_DN2079_c0_g3_i9:77-649(+)